MNEYESNPWWNFVADNELYAAVHYIANNCGGGNKCHDCTLSSKNRCCRDDASITMIHGDISGETDRIRFPYAHSKPSAMLFLHYRGTYIEYAKELKDKIDGC